MSSPVRRLSLVAPAALLVSLFLVSCILDLSGPGAKTGYFALAPAFPGAAATVIDVAGVHVVLRRTSDSSVALDTTVAMTPGDSVVDLSLAVVVTGPNETFWLEIECMDEAGSVVFAAGPLQVTATTSGEVEAQDIEVEYVGVGSNAAAVEILDSEVSLEFGATVALTAQALDSSGAPIPGTPIKWISHDTVRVIVPDPRVAQIQGGLLRGWAHVEARLLTGQADTIDVFVEPVPSVITVVAGDSQAGAANLPLRQPVVFRVDAADGPMQGVSVEFTTPDSGTFSPSVAVSDTAGLVSTNWTLGPEEKTQVAVATATNWPSVSTTFYGVALPVMTPRLSFTVQPSNTQPGVAINPPVEVTALGSGGELGLTYNGPITVAIGNNPGGGTLSGTTTVAAVNGVAAFDDLSIDMAGTGYTLTATAAGFQPDTSAAFNVSAPQAGGIVSWLANYADTDWHNAANWDLGRVPGVADTAVIAADVDVTVLLTSNATVARLEVGGAANVNTQTLDVAQGVTLQIDSGATIDSTGRLILREATFAGQGNLSVRGVVQSQGGTLVGPGSVVVEANGRFQMTGGMFTNRPTELDGRLLQNDFVLIWSGNDVLLSNGAQIVNNLSMDIRTSMGGALQQGAGAPGLLTNNGTLRRILTQDSCTISVPVISGSGSSIQILIGKLVLTDTSTLTNTSVVVGDAGVPAVLEFRAGTHTLDAASDILLGENGTVAFSGGTVTTAGSVDYTGAATGRAEVTAGTVNLNGSTSIIPRLMVSGGTLTGTQPIDVHDAMSLTTGTIGPCTVLRINNQATMTVGSPAPTIDACTIENSGTTVWQLGSVSGTNGAQFVNNAGATFEAQSAGTLLGGSGTFQNNGLFVHTSGGITTFSWALTNAGTIDAQNPSGTLMLTSDFTHQDGAVVQGSGTIDLTAANVLAWDGDVNPGTSPGILNFIGDAQPSALSTANIEIGGLTVGTEYDRAAVDGDFTADGGLNVSVINGFQPQVGQTFTVLTFTGIRSGDFASYTGMDLGGGLQLQPQWSATSLDLVVVQPPPAQILFAGDSGFGLSTGVFTVNSDATGLTHPYSTTSLGYMEVYPRWSPDRERIAFTNRTGFTPPNPNELYMMHATGDTLMTLVSDTSTFAPRWSPNGNHIAFECGNGSSEIDVCVITGVSAPLASLNGIGNGAGKIYVTDFDPVNWGDGPWVFAWDPLNHDRIAVVRDSVPPTGGSGQSMIYTMLYDGTGVQRLVPTGVLDAGAGPLRIIGGPGEGSTGGNLSWSPDGQWLVFTAYDPSGQQNIYRIDRNGGNLSALTATADYDDRPLWSPTGSEILFARDAGCDLDLWAMNADGSNPHQITAEHVCDYQLERLGADWSPDGQQIVTSGFFAQPYGPLGVYVVPRDANPSTYFNVRVLVGRMSGPSLDVEDIQPSWRP